jgi:hypothetical protein
VRRCTLFGTTILLSATFAVLAQQTSDPYGGTRAGPDVEAIDSGRLGQVTDAPALTKEEIVARMTSPNPAAATLPAGNGVYTVFIDDAQFASTCGKWTAQTAGLHPTGAGNNVIYRGGNPSTSYSTLRSYTTGIDYQTGSNACTGLCSLAAPVITPVMNGATTVGYTFAWTFADGANGTETIDNTVIRETHTVMNMGPGPFDFGLRKMWDWDISGPGVPSDDGPHFGDCQTPDEGCDRSMNLTGDGTLDGFYPQSYVMNHDPGVASCPPGVIPVGGPCGGNPAYIVAGTVAPPAILVPPPDAPDLLQFNRWSSLYGDCWQPALSDNTDCPGGDNAIGYFYGLNMPLTLAPGDSQSFTQYIVAGEDTCPDIVLPPGVDLDIKPGSCPNSWNRGSNGVLPVALTGSETFDVTEIDISTLQISRADGMGGSVGPNEGPPGPHTVVDDVATPFPGELCDCHEELGDGIPDLMMHFRTQEVVDALDMGDFMPGALVELVVSGLLLDATEFSASDCVRLVPPGTPPGQVFMTSNLTGAWVDVAPLDNTLDGGGFANFTRTYPQLTVLTLTAPESHLGRAFVGWRINGGPLVTEPGIPLVIVGEQTWVELLYYDPRVPSARPIDRVTPLE